MECAQVLYSILNKFLQIQTKILAEAIFFIWFAQHAAFSGSRPKVDDILRIKTSDIVLDELTVSLKEKEVDISGGLKELLTAWLGDAERKNRRAFFQDLSYDKLEDILCDHSANLYGIKAKLLPKDFLEKTHTTPGARIPLILRRQITEQEDLLKKSPYRIDSREIKKHILDSVQKKTTQNIS